MLQAGPKHTDVSVGQDADSEQASRRSRDEVEEVKSRLSTGSRGGAGAMADSEQAASRQQVSTGSTASTTDRLTSATAPSGGPAGAEEAASAASRPLRIGGKSRSRDEAEQVEPRLSTGRSREEVQVESLNTAGAMTEILPGHTRSKAKEDARERRSSAVSEIPPEDLELFDSRRTHLAKGTLDLKIMRRYLIQDHRFLDSFVEPGPQVFFQHKFIGHVEQIDLKEEVFAGLISDDLASLRAQEQVPDASCTKGFKDLMLEVAKTGTLGEMLAVLLVCEWTYLSWAQAVEEEALRENFVLYEWIDLHTCLVDVVAYLQRLLDKEGFSHFGAFCWLPT
eukprot:g10154.t1